MASLTTGLIENTAVSGTRPSQTLTLRMTNDDTVSASIQTMGSYLKGTQKTEYVLELFNLPPGDVANRNYFAQFDAFEFRFITSSDAVRIFAWGKDAAEELTILYRVLSEERKTVGVEGIMGASIPSPINRIYIANYHSNTVSVIDGKINSVIATVTVGSGPYGVGVNPITNRIYVTNQGSDNVSVINGNTNTVIATFESGSENLNRREFQ